MSRYYGYVPKGRVKDAVESFESATVVTAPGGVLLATVYVDIREEEWAVALAYGRARHPKIRGPEPDFEVKYSYRPGNGAGVSFLDTREGEAVSLPSGPFTSADDFVAWAIEKEKERLGRKGG